jgi:hypothetical protein
MGIMNFNVEYHREGRFVLKWSNQLAEFIPEDFINETTDFILKEKQLLNKCIELSRNALLKLHARLGDYVKANITTSDSHVGEIAINES